MADSKENYYLNLGKERVEKRETSEKTGRRRRNATLWNSIQTKGLSNKVATVLIASAVCSETDFVA